MMRAARSVCACAAWLALAAGVALSADLADPVPGHPDHTYEDIVRLVTPDVVKGEYRHAGTLPDNIRAFSPLVPTALTPGRGEFDPPEAVAFRAGGKDRVLLLMNFALRTQYDETFAALSLIGFDAGPARLDIVNVSTGMDVFFLDPKVLDIGEGESAVLVQSQMQSGQTIYNNYALILPRNDVVERIAELWTANEMGCAGMHFFQPSFAAVSGTGRFGDIKVTMVEEQEGGASQEDCGDEPLPEPFRRETTVTYRWDESLSQYRPDSSAFDSLAR
ncbi:MAG: hypothetical protein KF723_08840 [Rhizobiaceae bacterium]|nr:hypothetical protein [Rhizobiaceae bacterium]